MAEVYNAAYVEELLEEARKQLLLGPPTLKVKSCLRKMLEMIASPPAQTTAPPSAVKKKLDVDDSMLLTVECHVCGQERRASFYKRGFKCDRCRGNHGRALGTPQTANASMVPSLALPRQFYFAPVARLEESSRIAAEGGDIDPILPSSVKYTVFRLPLAEGCEAVARAARIKICHPAIVCIFTTCVDRKRQEVSFVHETAIPILDSALLSHAALSNSSFTSTFSSFTSVRYLERDGRSGNLQVLERTYDRMKKVILSTFHALAFLHKEHFIHNDLRPHNILVDANQNIKLRFAAFAQSPLPPPFSAPELRTSPGAVATKESDIYTLGVSLSIIAYGAALEFPPEHAQSFDDVQLIGLIRHMTAEKPSERCTIAKALSNGYLASIRFVDGVPVDTLLAQVGVSAEGPALPYIAQRENATPETIEFLQFLAEHGPAFQVIRGNTYVSLYSIKSDPRRRRAKTIVDAANAAEHSRNRSATMPPK